MVSLAPKLGDLVVVRRLSQSPRCNVDVTAGPLVSFQVRAEASDALVSFVPVNTCTETPVANRLFVGSNSSQALNLVGGTLMIVRSTAAGNPIRRVLRVTTATDPVVRLGETLIFFMSCNPPPGPAGSLPVTPNVPFVVSLAAQGQFVLNDVPAGHYCDVKPSSSYTYAGATEDTTEPIGDSFVVVPERSSSCPKATLTTPVPGPVGCYAEMVITN